MIHPRGWRLQWAAALLLSTGCGAPEAAAPPDTATSHCGRCDRDWSDAELEFHDRHLEELGLRMYASGCEFCRYHGAYKDA